MGGSNGAQGGRGPGELSDVAGKIGPDTLPPGGPTSDPRGTEGTLEAWAAQQQSIGALHAEQRQKLLAAYLGAYTAHTGLAVQDVELVETHATDENGNPQTRWRFIPRDFVSLGFDLVNKIDKLCPVDLGEVNDLLKEVRTFISNIDVIHAMLASFNPNDSASVMANAMVTLREVGLALPNGPIKEAFTITFGNLGVVAHWLQTRKAQDWRDVDLRGHPVDVLERMIRASGLPLPENFAEQMRAMRDNFDLGDVETAPAELYVIMENDQPHMVMQPGTTEADVEAVRLGLQERSDQTDEGLRPRSYFRVRTTPVYHVRPAEDPKQPTLPFAHDPGPQG